MSRDTSLVVVEKKLAPPEIDRVLRRIAVAQAALDADEAHWLRLADEQKIWPALGYVHALEYLEDVFGYAPKTAQERLRVARELGALPSLEDALRCGELSHSVVRELTRVATPETVDRWLERARGRRLRDVEQMVSGRKKGDDPDAAPDPARVTHRLVLELDGESMAIWRQMQQAAELEIGQSLDDRSLVLALGDRVLHHIDTERPTAEPRYRKQIVTCRDCKRGWMDGAGVRFEVGDSLLERAECDAIVVDDEQGKRPTRTIPAAVERLVFERAQHRCQVPGCRASKHLSIHHIQFWSQGGDHDPANLIVLCNGHHRLLHDRVLRITGRAPDELVFERNGVVMRGAVDATDLLLAAPRAARVTGHSTHTVAKHTPTPSKRRLVTPILDDDDHQALARAALRQLDFKAAEAERAVEAASAHVGADAELGVLIKEALRQLAPKK